MSKRRILAGFKVEFTYASTAVLKDMPRCHSLSPGCISAYGFENGNPRRLTHAFNYKGAALAGLERLQLDDHFQN